MAKELAVKRRKKLKIDYPNLIVLIILIIASIFVIYPLLLIVNISFKTYPEFLRDPIGLANQFNLDNYKVVWEKLNVVRNSINTLFFTAISIVIHVTIVVFASYPISRKHFKGANAVYVFILISMLMPTTMIATLFIQKYVLNIYGTPLALIYVWALGGVQFHTFMVVGFIKMIPKDLDEAAFIDGCSYTKYVYKIIIPLLKPVMATIIIFKAISSWNDFLTPFIYAGSKVKTLSTGLFFYMGQYGNKWHLLTSAVFIVALPMIILFIIAQKWIINGLISGALKG